MKKFITITVLLFSINGAYAQLQWGLKGGLNLSNYIAGETDFNSSLHAGLELQYMFTERFGIESGLYYSGLGAKKELNLIDENGGADVKQKKTYHTDNIQIPLLFLLKFKVSDGVYLCPSAGGYVGSAVGGKINAKTEILSSWEKQTNNFYTSEASISDMLDAGASVGLSLEFTDYFTRSTYNDQTNKIIIGIGYERGFMNVKSSDSYLSGIDDLYNQNIKASVGFLF